MDIYLCKSCGTIKFGIKCYRCTDRAKGILFTKVENPTIESNFLLVEGKLLKWKFEGAEKIVHKSIKENPEFGPFHYLFSILALVTITEDTDVSEEGVNASLRRYEKFLKSQSNNNEILQKGMSSYCTTLKWHEKFVGTDLNENAFEGVRKKLIAIDSSFASIYDNAQFEYDEGKFTTHVDLKHSNKKPIFNPEAKIQHKRNWSKWLLYGILFVAAYYGIIYYNRYQEDKVHQQMDFVQDNSASESDNNKEESGIPLGTKKATAVEVTTPIHSPTYDLLQGEWQMTDNPSSHLIIENDKMGDEQFVLSDRCMNAAGNKTATQTESYKYLSLIESNVCYHIVELDSEHLTMDDVDGSNTLMYIKVKKN